MLRQQIAPMDAAARVRATVIATRTRRARRSATHRGQPVVSTGASVRLGAQTKNAPAP